MTKNIFIVAIAVLLSVAFCSLSAQNVSKDYNVDEFSAINLQSVGNIIFTRHQRQGLHGRYVEFLRGTLGYTICRLRAGVQQHDRQGTTR